MSVFKSRRSKCFPKKFPARNYEDIEDHLFDYSLVKFQKIINFLSHSRVYDYEFWTIACSVRGFLKFLNGPWGSGKKYFS